MEKPVTYAAQAGLELVILLPQLPGCLEQLFFNPEFSGKICLI
jgi:hypothetical protein